MIRCAWRGGGLGSAVLNITMQGLVRMRDQDSTIHSAVYAGNVALVLDHLIVDPACVDEISPRYHYNGTPLLVAIDGGHLDIVRLFLDKGADVNAFVW